MGRLSGFDTFIFDWDGTISKLGIIYLINRKLNPYWLYRKSRSFRGVREPRESEIRKYIGNVYSREMYAIRDRENLIMVRMIDVLHNFSRPKLNYGAGEVLRRLSRKGKSIAVFTDGNISRVLREAEELGVDRYIDAALSAQSIRRLKPDPLGLRLLLKELDSDKRRSLVVGDTYDDILSARRAGIRSCAVATGLSGFESLKTRDPDYLFRNFHELELEL